MYHSTSSNILVQFFYSNQRDQSAKTDIHTSQLHTYTLPSAGAATETHVHTLVYTWCIHVKGMYTICGMNRGIAAHLDSFILPITVIIISLNLQFFYSKSSLIILLLITDFFSLYLPNHIHFTLCVCVCWHLSDLCEDQFRVGKVNRTGAGKYSHVRSLLCLF